MEKVTYFSNLAGRVDPEEGVIYGVSVITMGKAKGHDLLVDETTLSQIKEQADMKEHGLKAKLNHRTGVEAIFGSLKNFQINGPKLTADLHMLKNHRDYDQTLEQIRTMPTELGLSVAFVGKEEHNNSGEKLARCKEIISTDLVPEPAANPTGMFEAKEDKVDTELEDMKIEDTLKGIQETLEGINGRLEGVEQFNQAIQSEVEQAAQEDQVFYDADGNLLDAQGSLITDDAGNALTVEDLQETQNLIEQGIIDGEGNILNPEALAGTPAGNSSVDGINPPAGQAGAGGIEGGNATYGAPSQYQPAGVAEQSPAERYPNEAPAVQEALGRVDKLIVELEAQKQSQEEAAERHEFDSAIGVLRDKITALAEVNETLELKNTALTESLKVGAPAIEGSAHDRIHFESKAGNNGTFESRTAQLVEEGKSRTEAVTLARKEDPSAYQEYLGRIGVIQTMEAN